MYYHCYMLLVWNIMKCETWQCNAGSTRHVLVWHKGSDSWGHMGTLEAVELGHAREVTRLGHPDICYLEITNSNINLVHFSLQPKNLKWTSLAIQCQNLKIYRPTYLAWICSNATDLVVWEHLPWSQLWFSQSIKISFLRLKYISQ